MAEKQPKRKMKHGKLWLTLVMIVAAMGSVLVYIRFFYLDADYRLVTKDTKPIATILSQPKITPTLYITGSGGQVDELSELAQSAQVGYGQEAPIKINVSLTRQISVAGTIGTENKTPLIQIGGLAFVGDNGTEHAKALKKVIDYLRNNYNLDGINLVGFSAGGTSSWEYLLHDQISGIPVKKFVSLSGQYNYNNDFSKGETLDDILQNGPKNQSDVYKKYPSYIKKVSNKTKILMLSGDEDEKSQSTDGMVNWADTFSIYHLLKNNGNTVDYEIFKGNDTSHLELPNNKDVQTKINEFLYK